MLAEPLIRIGLSTNSSSVSITTTDSSLVAVSPDEQSRLLATNKVTVSARAYRPPEIENYRIEFQNLPSQSDANVMAKDIRDATGETALASIDTATNTWKVWVGSVKETSIDADELKAKLAEKGFDDAVVVVEKKTVMSVDAVALSEQLKTSGPSEVRSLIKPIGSTQPNVMGPVAANLREVIVSGPSESARYSSLKSVAFGSLNERANPVRLNGKAYRGKIEVFVNSRGSLTVVNVVPLEDYLLGVIPAELGLPQLEAQKAQAVAARTYAVANIGTYGKQGFDMVPTVWSQVYKGVSIETKMGTQAVQQTRGIVATYQGKPIMAYFTSTCGGRTEDGGNIFDKDEPYLRGVECSLEGRRHFEPFLVKTSRQPAKLRDEGNLELVRLMSLLAANGFQLSTGQMTDDWFEDVPTDSEMSNWLNNIAGRFGKTYPNVNRDTAKPTELARILAGFIYAPGYADAMLTDSDINYQLSFDDAAEIPKDRRADFAILLRDGYFAIHPDLTLKPNRPFTRGKMLRLIRQIYEKKKWMAASLSGTTKATADGKLILKIGQNGKAVDRPSGRVFVPRIWQYHVSGSRGGTHGWGKRELPARCSRSRQVFGDQANRYADNGRKHVALGLLEQIFVARRGAVAIVPLCPRDRHVVRYQHKKGRIFTTPGRVGDNRVERCQDIKRRQDTLRPASAGTAFCDQQTLFRNDGRGLYVHRPRLGPRRWNVPVRCFWPRKNGRQI